MKMRIKTGMTVKVITGKDKGKTGTVIQVFPKAETVVIEGVNVVKKHVRSKKQGEKGTRIELSYPIHASNVSLLNEKEA